MSNEKAIIKASTPNSDKYDAKIDVYNKDPKSGPHDTVHIAVTTEDHLTTLDFQTLSGLYLDSLQNFSI